MEFLKFTMQVFKRLFVFNCDTMFQYMDNEYVKDI